MEEDQVIPKNFFFRKPHIRMFRMNPFDDAEMHLEMDELRSSRDQSRTELKKSITDQTGILHEIHNHVQGFEVSTPELVVL